MRDFRDAKAMGGSLRKALETRGYAITHSDSLELISNAFGFDNWNILAAKIEAAKPPTEPVRHTPENPGESHEALYCSFCGKSQHWVAKLIAGPKVFICDECVDRCDAILEEEDEIVQVRLEQQGGLSLTEILTRMPGDRLLALERAVTRAGDQSRRTARVAEAILAGSAQVPGDAPEDRALDTFMRTRSVNAVKSELAESTRRKTEADQILAEAKKILAARGK